MEKLLAMYVAAQLAHASAGNAAPDGNLPISPEISDASVRAKNLMVWEDFRIFYHAVVKALADDNPDTGWPAPKVEVGGLLNPDTLGPILKKLLGAASLVPGLGTPLPNPGK
jgi:hypothetical protein